MLLTLREHSALTCPVGNLADKVEEEISLGNTNHFVAHLYEEAETLVRLHLQSARNCLDEITTPC